MFHEDKTITRQHGINYYHHLHNNTNEPSEIEIENTIDEISSAREHYKSYISEIIYKFWFDIANKIGINSVNGQQIRDNKNLVKSLSLIDNHFELHKIVLLLHVIFDWLPNYQDKIIDLMEEKFPIKILKVPKINNKRSKCHCMHLLITKVITNERKIINSHLKNSIGIKVFITKEVTPGVTSKINRRLHHCIHPWMIRGNFVSKIFILLCFNVLQMVILTTEMVNICFKMVIELIKMVKYKFEMVIKNSEKWYLLTEMVNICLKMVI